MAINNCDDDNVTIKYKHLISSTDTILNNLEPVEIYRPLINSWPTKGESQCSIHLVDEVT